MKTKTYVHNLIILDQSGSMDAICRQALSGVNETFQTIKAAQEKFPEQIQKVTFMTFCSLEQNHFNYIIVNEDAPRVRTLTPQDYHPDGCTPLYDAIGLGIRKLVPYVRKGDKVLVTIITDGMENSSVHYSHHQLGKLISMYKEKGWLFTYIGANQDAHGVAGSIHIDYAMDFNANEESAGLMFEKMNACRMECYSRVHEDNPIADMDFFREKEQLQRITPEEPGQLQPQEMEVTGSKDKEGVENRTYSICTRDYASAEKSIFDFIDFADRHPETVFLVRPMPEVKGKLKERDYAKLFARAIGLQNIHLPARYWQLINRI